MKVLLGQIMYDKNLSVRQVSIMTGVSKSTINRIVNGQVSPTLDTVEQLAKRSPSESYRPFRIRYSISVPYLGRFPLFKKVFINSRVLYYRDTNIKKI